MKVAAARLITALVGAGPAVQPYDFDPNHVVDVDVHMPSQDWDVLRYTHRCPFADYASDACATDLFESPYVWSTATITIDGQTLSRVGIRKKGFGTTYETRRPGIKLRFDKHVEGQRWRGLTRMTLNTTSDPLRTCLAYSVLRDAGLFAPRCAFARVRVNGAALGVYPVVEAIDGDFLAEHFERTDGALFEGQLNDFRPDYRPHFEHKRGPAGQGPIERLTRVLAREDGDVAEALETVVDLDAFLTFWAADALIARWDGYAGHMNNFFVYEEPTSQKLLFIPWGGNRATFETLRDPVLSPPDRAMPESVIAHGILARRLYASEAGRARYVQKLKALMKRVWNEDRILQRIRRMERTLARHGRSGPSTAGIRRFVRTRRRVLDAELKNGPVPWPLPPPHSPCMVPTGTVRGTFSTVWTSTAAPPAERAGLANLEVSIDDAELVVQRATARAGSLVLASIGAPLPRPSEGSAAIIIRAKLRTQSLELILVAPPELVSSGSTISFGDQRPGCSGAGAPFGLICIDGVSSCLQPAFVSEGVLTFDEGMPLEGAPISGWFTAALKKQPWGLFEGHPDIWHRGAPDRAWIRGERHQP